MKYLKKFEGYNEKSLAREIAEDILPKIEEIKKEKGIFTIGMFDNYMEERKADMKLTDEVISELVNMGFDFDSNDDDVEFYFDDEDDQDGPPPGFEGYPGMEYSLN
jgi:regulator of RNase E activity RraB